VAEDIVAALAHQLHPQLLDRNAADSGSIRSRFGSSS
jgi:hypothetical protein